MDTARRLLACFRFLAVVRHHGCFRFVKVGPDLDSRVERGICFYFELEDEVAIFLFGTEEAIRAAFGRSADDLTFLNFVSRFAVALFPAVEVDVGDGLTRQRFQ